MNCKAPYRAHCFDSEEEAEKLRDEPCEDDKRVFNKGNFDEFEACQVCLHHRNLCISDANMVPGEPVPYYEWGEGTPV